MPYYRKCPACGAALDPGEICDCQNKKTAPDAANIESGKVKSDLRDHIFTLMIPGYEQKIKGE